MRWPKFWLTLFWTENDHEVCAYEGRDRSFDSRDQALTRARLLYARQAGNEPWGGTEISELHIDVMVQNDERSAPMILESFRKDEDE